LPIGVAAAQLVHAAGESSPGNLPKGTYAIVLAVPSIDKLLALEQRLIEDDIPHKAIRKPDSPYNNEIMSIGIKPTSRIFVKKYTSNLPLLK